MISARCPACGEFHGVVRAVYAPERPCARCQRARAADKPGVTQAPPFPQGALRPEGRQREKESE